MSKYIVFFNEPHFYNEIYIKDNHELGRRITEFEHEMKVDTIYFTVTEHELYPGKSSICWEFSSEDLFYVLLKYPEFVDGYIEKE